MAPMSSTGKIMAVALACCGLAFRGTAGAEPPKGGSDAAVVQTLRKAQGMLRQLGQEKAELEARNAALEERLKGLETRAAQVEPLQNQLKQAKTSLEASQGNNAALQQQLTGQASRLEAATELQRKAGGELARYRRDNLLLVNAVKERTRWIGECTGKNKGLVAANRDMIAQVGNRGFWDELKESEPLTGLGAVARENEVQDFLYKLDDLEVTPWQEPQTLDPAPPAETEPEAKAAGSDAE